MSFAMDLAAFGDMWRWKWQYCKLFPCFYLKHNLYPPLHDSPSSYLIDRSASDIRYANKNYLKLWEIQLAI